MKLHLLCATNRVPISYELTPANVADILLTKELLEEAGLSEEVARRLLGDLAYRSEKLKEELAEVGVLLATERSERRSRVRQQIEIAISSLKRVFGLGETLARSIIGLDHLAFTVDPHRLNPTEPQALYGKQARNDAHPAPTLLDPTVVGGDLLPNSRKRRS